MNKELRISVLIPTFNSEKSIIHTLATIFKQSYKPFEVIVVDGASTDSTPKIIDAYGELITSFISEPDKGQLDAVQKGIQIASGDILYWINADDAVMPGSFLRVAKAFAEDPSVQVVYGDNYWFDEATRRFGVAHSVKRLTFWDQFLFYGQIQVESFFWRRELSEKALPFDTDLRVYTDYSFLLPVRYGAKCKWISSRLGAFRVSAGQMSTIYRARGDAEKELVKQRMRDRLGISIEEFNSLKRSHRVSYLIRHKLLPKVVSGLRFTGRKMSGDYLRNKLAKFFFDEWLKPPLEVERRLQEIKRSA